MSDLSFEDYKQSILPMLKKVLTQQDVDLDTEVRKAVAKMQIVYEFDDELRDRLIEHLRTNFNSTGTIPAVLRGREYHEPWLSQRKQDPDLRWDQWSRYQYYLRSVKGWPEPTIRSLDETSDEILDLLEDPMADTEFFDRRGLVMGHVQSGKTASFTSLINKAFDCGYKIVIVLSGLHNNLRSQTQVRLDEEVIGFTMKRKHQKEERRVGVGLLPGYQLTDVISLTNSDNDGDFSVAKAKVMFNPPILLVVKKNKTVLTNLLHYLRGKNKFAKEKQGRDHRVIPDLPLLLIDDEADQASVNTADIYLDDGVTIDPEYEPAKINGLIRDIFHTFEKRAYVGYTATPFANFMIDRESYTQEYGFDLFPKDFIYCLPKPGNYAGPAEYFGLYDDPERPQPSLVRQVEQDPQFIPVPHKKEHAPPYLPPNLIESLYAFIVATGLRRLRGQDRQHSSMLIHVTRFTDVQDKVYHLVATKVNDIIMSVRNGTGNTDHDHALRKLYQEDFVPTSAGRKDGGKTFDWPAVRQALLDVLGKVKVKQINGLSSDILDYEENKEQGLYVIAVGGDKLSRGLTLEGLTVSYYLRTSSLYDTLMQMGRWFGYRMGYFDLCRIYTTEILRDYFQQVAIATEDVRAQIVDMAEHGMTPDDYVLRVRAHPDLGITAPNKMRAAQIVKTSYSASLVQTVRFRNSASFFQHNFAATERLLSWLQENCGQRLEAADQRPYVSSLPGYHYWDHVPTERVLTFLEQYRTHGLGGRTDSESWREYISNRLVSGELKEWTVVLVGSGSGAAKTIAGLPVRTSKRFGDSDGYSVTSESLSIRILTSEGHEYLDYPLELHARAQELLNQDRSEKGRREKASLYGQARSLRRAEKGLLLIYPLDVEAGVLKEATDHLGLTDLEIPIGIALSFPTSNQAHGDMDVVVNKSVG
jgi:hypothetical protein